MRRAYEHVVVRGAVGRRGQKVDLAVDEVQRSFVSHYQAIALFRLVIHLDYKTSTG